MRGRGTASRWMRSRRTRTPDIVCRASEDATRRGEAHRRHGEGCPPLCGGGWVGGVYPSAPLQARTAASDGHCAFTRAARSAGLNFAVIALSKTVDVVRDHLIHRKRSPFPYEGKALTPLILGRVCECRAGHCQIAASEALPRRSCALHCREASESKKSRNRTNYYFP